MGTLDSEPEGFVLDPWRPNTWISCVFRRLGAEHTDFSEVFQGLGGFWIATNACRIQLAKRDVEHGLEIVLEHFRTKEKQIRAVEILHFKLNLLWDIADGIAKHYAPEFETKGYKEFFK